MKAWTAAQAYERTAREVTGPDTPASPRAQEAYILEALAQRLERARAAGDIAGLKDALWRNQALWTLVQAQHGEGETPLPAELRRDLLGIALRVDRLTFDARAGLGDDPVGALARLNLRVASHLRAAARGAKPESPAGSGARGAMGLRGGRARRRS